MGSCIEKYLQSILLKGRETECVFINLVEILAINLF